MHLGDIVGRWYYMRDIFYIAVILILCAGCVSNDNSSKKRTLDDPLNIIGTSFDEYISFGKEEQISNSFHFFCFNISY